MNLNLKKKTCFRYTGDIALISSTDVITSDLLVKYSSNLILTSNALHNNCLNFLDSNIQTINNKLYLDIYDKLTHFKFYLYVSVYRNIILNNLYRIKNLCSSKHKNKPVDL